MQVAAQLGANHADKPGASATVDYPALDAEDLATLTEHFGEDTVFAHAKRSFVVSLQSYMRTQIEAGKTPEEIQASCVDWKPGQKRPGKSPAERVQELMAKMSPSDRESLLKEYVVKGKRQQAAA